MTTRIINTVPRNLCVCVPSNWFLKKNYHYLVPRNNLFSIYCSIVLRNFLFRLSLHTFILIFSVFLRFHRRVRHLTMFRVFCTQIQQLSFFFLLLGKFFPLCSPLTRLWLPQFLLGFGLSLNSWNLHFPQLLSVQSTKFNLEQAEGQTLELITYQDESIYNTREAYLIIFNESFFWYMVFSTFNFKVWLTGLVWWSMWVIERVTRVVG